MGFFCPVIYYYTDQNLTYPSQKIWSLLHYGGSYVAYIIG